MHIWIGTYVHYIIPLHTRHQLPTSDMSTHFKKNILYHRISLVQGRSEAYLLNETIINKSQIDKLENEKKKISKKLRRKKKKTLPWHPPPPQLPQPALSGLTFSAKKKKKQKKINCKKFQTFGTDICFWLTYLLNIYTWTHRYTHMYRRI